MPALAIRQDLSATELRRLARLEPARRAAMRLLAIANALEGLTRAEAARLAGMERQALRDAVIRYNAEGPSGLHDRPRSGRPEALAPGQQAALKAWVLRGPNPERDGVSAWRVVDVCAHAEEAYGVRYSEWGMHGAAPEAPRALTPEDPATAPPGQRDRAGRVQKMDLARGSPRSPPCTRTSGCSSGARMRPGSGRRAGPATAGTNAACARPGSPTDKRFESLSLFAACRPGTDQAFALALPEATATTMDLFLAGFAEQLEPGAHAVLILDRAGWHGSRRLTVPANVTLVPLPPYSPELNPVERVWLYLRERFLSHRVLDGYAAVLDAACRAWNALAAEPGRLSSLTAYPYLLRSELL
jgi:transposase